MAGNANIIIRAPAKLNLSLDVVGEDGAGYHLLDGVMLAVDLYDTLTLRLERGEGIRVVCDGPETVPLDEGNLAAKAARLLLQEVGVSLPGMLWIEIAKKIPLQAGMAGGSADAAAVLEGLNVLLEIGLNRSRRMELGLRAGSDVPFCLLGGCARAQGRGERLEPLPLPEGALLIAKPPESSETRAAFACYDRGKRQMLRPDVPAMVQALRQGDPAGVGRAMGNVFEQVCAPSAVRELTGAIKQQGALGAAMTGTGTAVAGLFASETAAQSCLQFLNQRGYPLEYLGIHRPVPGGAHAVSAR